MSLSDWMVTATKPGPFSPPGLAVAINDSLEVCGVDGAGVPLTVDSIWPLACLTKLALADLAVRTLPLDAYITRWLPEVETPATVRQLLTHTAGLPMDLPCDRYGQLNADGVCRAALAMRPTLQPGSMAYSNIGYGWIALALERATGRPLAELWAAYDLVSSADVLNPVTIADVRSPHVGTSLEPCNGPYWRALALPWCGAFGTISAVRALINRLDPRVTSERLTAPGGFPKGAYFGFTENDGIMWNDAAWSCGVERRGTKVPHWITSKVSQESFGHIATSGVLVWKDGAQTFVLAGSRTTDCGWILRHGPKASAFAFNEALQPQ